VAITASELRQNIYRLLDQVLETGVPLEITRGDSMVRIVPVVAPRKLAQLPMRNLFACDPDELVTSFGDEATAVAGMEPCS
jgi:antitoxin (DNA-binding transcriptional repressor) of toxin-antitoxin stability system